jgi:hypothetical protein
MRWLRAVIGEIFGLFVDEGGFALAIVAWIAVAWLALPRLDAASKWNGVILFVGLAVILVGSVLRRTRK